MTQRTLPWVSDAGTTTPWSTYCDYEDQASHHTSTALRAEAGNGGTPQECPYSFALDGDRRRRRSSSLVLSSSLHRSCNNTILLPPDISRWRKASDHAHVQAAPPLPTLFLRLVLTQSLRGYKVSTWVDAHSELRPLRLTGGEDSCSSTIPQITYLDLRPADPAPVCCSSRRTLNKPILPPAKTTPSWRSLPSGINSSSVYSLLWVRTSTVTISVSSQRWWPVPRSKRSSTLMTPSPDCEFPPSLAMLSTEC